MLFPEEPGKATPSDELQLWAKLESKSDSMADELVRNLQLKARCHRGTNRFANTLVVAVLLGVSVGVALVALQSEDATDPPASSGIVSKEMPRLDPR